MSTSEVGTSKPSGGNIAGEIRSAPGSGDATGSLRTDLSALTALARLFARQAAAEAEVGPKTQPADGGASQ